MLLNIRCLIELKVMHLPKGSQKTYAYDQIIPRSIVTSKRMKTIAPYRRGWPEGAVIHFTAGKDSSEDDAKISIDEGVANNYAYIVIGPTGVVYETHNIRNWGYHAGESYLPSLGKGVSQYLIGIEVCCPGLLEEKDGVYKTWWGKEVPKKDVVYFAGVDNIKRGVYKRFSDNQIKSLVELLLWFHAINPKVFSLQNVVGHDEVSPDRKSDPGGSLMMTMPSFREMLYLKSKNY